MRQNYNYKLLVATVIILTVCSIAFYFYWDTTKIIIRKILEARFTYFLLWIATVVIFLLHYIKHSSKEIESDIIFTKVFGSFIDNALAGVTYGTVITTTLTLLKGIYIQQFFNDRKYFSEFNSFDLTAISGLMAFILYLSAMKVIGIAKETYKTKHTEVVKNEDNIPVIHGQENEGESVLR